MIHVHWTSAAAAIAACAGLIAFVHFLKSDGMFDFSPLVGCAGFLAGICAALMILLAHAWGWL